MCICVIMKKSSIMTVLHSTYLQMTDDPETIADDSRMLAPRIAGFIGDDEGQYFLIVESNIVIVTQTSSFNNALLLWFCLFYTLNLEYPKAVSEVCIFFQEFVFGLPTSSAYRRCKSVTYLSTTTDIQVCPIIKIFSHHFHISFHSLICIFDCIATCYMLFKFAVYNLFICKYSDMVELSS